MGNFLQKPNVSTLGVLGLGVFRKDAPMRRRAEMGKRCGGARCGVQMAFLELSIHFALLAEAERPWALIVDLASINPRNCYN